MPENTPSFQTEAELKEAILGMKDNDKVRDFLLKMGQDVIRANALVSETEKERQKVAQELASQRSIVEDLKRNFKEKYDSSKTPEETLYKLGLMYRAIAQGRRDEAYKAGALLFGAGVDTIRSWPTSKQMRDVREKADLGTPLYSDATTGSYLVRVDYIAEVLRIAKQASVMMGQVSTYPMSGITAYIPKAGTEPTFTWLSAQSTAKTETNPTFDRVTLTAYTAALWLAYVDELEEDSIVPLGMYFRDTIGEAWGLEFDRACLTKNSGGSDLWSGALHAGTAITTMGAGETGFADVDLDHLESMIQSLGTTQYRLGCKWYWHPTVFDYLRQLKDANGQYRLNPYGDQNPPTIKGFPHVESDIMPDSGDSAAATKFAVLMNPKRVIHGDRVGLAIKRFDQTAYRVEYDEIFLQARVRAAFAVSHADAIAVLKTATA